MHLFCFNQDPNALDSKFSSFSASKHSPWAKPIQWCLLHSMFFKVKLLALESILLWPCAYGYAVGKKQVFQWFQADLTKQPHTHHVCVYLLHSYVIQNVGRFLPWHLLPVIPSMEVMPLSASLSLFLVSTGLSVCVRKQKTFLINESKW